MMASVMVYVSTWMMVGLLASKWEKMMTMMMAQMMDEMNDLVMGCMKIYWMVSEMDLMKAHLMVL